MNYEALCHEVIALSKEVGQFMKEENKKIRWGEVIIKGNASIPTKLIQSFIQIKPGDLFQEAQLQKIPKKIK